MVLTGFYNVGCADAGRVKEYARRLRGINRHTLHEKRGRLFVADGGATELDMGPAGDFILVDGDIRQLRTSTSAGSFRPVPKEELARRIARLVRSEPENWPACLAGEYALLRWDETSSTLTLIRDRLGVKQLYYAEVGGLVLFGTHLTHLVEIEPYLKSIDFGSVLDYFIFQINMRHKTCFKGAEVLPPGTSMRAHPGGIKIKRYWRYEPAKSGKVNQAECSAAVNRTLKGAIKRRLSADVPLGAHLSGGIDSSIISTYVNEMTDATLRTYSGTFDYGPKYDETGYALAVASRINCEHTIVRPSPADVVNELENILTCLEEPKGGVAAFSRFVVARRAARDVRCIYNGQGADELFTGYPWYLAYYVEYILNKGFISGFEKVRGISDILDNLGSYIECAGGERLCSAVLDGINGMPLPSAGQYFYSRRKVFDFDEIGRVFKRQTWEFMTHDFPTREDYIASLPGREKGLKELNLIDIEYFLPSWTSIENSFSAFFKMQPHYPFLDQEVLDLSAKLPYNIKLDKLVLKGILRKAFKGRLPSSVLKHEKIGFRTPFGDMVKDGLMDFVRAELLESPAGLRFCDRRYLTKILNMHEAGRINYGWQIWSLLCFLRWAETHKLR